MNAGQFRKVDPDLLADYVGGALDGTPDEVVVGRLIMDDPAWAAAHSDLAEATGTVRSGLAEWGATPETMPLEITDRLTAALADAARTDAASDGAARKPAALTAVPHEAGVRRAPAGVRPARGGVRRRWSRWAAPAAVAAGVAVVAGFGITQFAPRDNIQQTDAAAPSSEPGQRKSMPEGESAIASGSSADAPRTAPPPSTRQVVSSGTDYGPTTLPTSVAAFSKDSSPRPLTAQDASTAPSLPAVPPALRRLADPGALSACLGTLTTAHGRGPVSVDLVDYASFQGSPALIVAFANAAAERWVWVAGPQCGSDETGPDTRYIARVG
ncbi:hypothetical protein [Micromonospora sp. NPDC049679]|uniref:hypothetical protein n=1 Tax=Micromonospora sp. NPDC049679 TaxID=3155920 RepID=UPI0033CE3651